MITGTQNPMVGQEEFYEFSNSLDIFNNSKATFVWNIWKKNKSGSWINITQKPAKMGQKVPFKFGEKVIGVEFKLQVYKATKRLLSNEFEAKLAGEINVIPRSAKAPKIDKVVLFNQGAKDPNKASYKDSLIARAHCVAMFNQEVEFRLWEDDAAGGGHNATINKNNQLPQVFKARVNEKGIAEVKISLLSNEKVLKAIANKYVMSGDKSEGANHEFYVTASYNGKNQGANKVNVDVTNPDYKAKPKEDSAIFSGTSNQPEKLDKEKKVTHAYFINSTGNPTNHIKVGDSVRIRIKTNNMIGEYFQYIVWEKDRVNSDDIFRSPKIKIIGNSIDTAPITITQKKFDEGIDANFPLSGDPDKDQQQYFIEIIPLTSNAKSVSFGIDDEAKRTKVDSGVSPAVVKEKPTPEKLQNKECCIIDEEFFFTNYEKEFPTKDQHGNIIPLSGLVKISLSRIFKSISEYYANEKKCCNKYRIAYMLATVKLETGHTFNPVEEANWLSWKVRKKYFEDMYDPVLGKNEARKNKAIEIGNTFLGDGVKYYGRGYVQITGKTNYQKMKDKFNIDFVNDVTKVTEHEWAMKILIYGSEEGIFTGKKLSNYISDSKKDYTNARRVINGIDKASTIAGYAEKIEKGIKIKTCNCGETSSSPKNSNPPTSAEKIVYFDNNLTQDRINVVSQFAINLLERAAKNSVNDKIVITSTIRSTRKQAEAMYENENAGNHIRYAAPGREVVEVFNNGKRKGESKEKIISDMDNKVKDLAQNGRRVSLHCVSPDVYKQNNIIDISYTNGIKNPRDLIKELVKDPAVTKIIHPLNNVTANSKISYDTKEPAIHVEIKVP